MIFAVENKITEPINLGSGVGYTIKEVVQIVIENSDRNNEIKWNNSVPSGDIKRLFSMDRSKSYGFEPKTSLREGIKKTYDWYRSNKALLKNKYNPFINH
jgi:GDP-L-fucose synthase